MAEPTISERRADTESRIEALRQQRGVAMLDGQPFDNEALANLETELDSLTAAEGEQVRRERQALAAAEAERLAALRKKLSIVEKHRLEDVQRAEDHARGLCEALKAARERGVEATRILRALNINPAIKTDVFETELRLSLRLGCAMKPLAGISGKFGLAQFPVAREPWDEPWLPAERAAVAPDINRAIEGSAS